MTRRRKRRGFMWPYIMDKLLRFGTLLVCLGFAAPALAQTYDEQPVPSDSTNCRAVVGQTDIDGTMQQIVGRACLQSDGTWQIVQSPDGSVLWYPVAAYPYPDPWWWGPPIFIGAGVSFIFVDHFHHFHHFDHFHQMGHVHFAPIGAGFHRGPFPGGGMRGFAGTRGFGGMHGVGGMHRR
jgi:surface antigen